MSVDEFLVVLDPPSATAGAEGATDSEHPLTALRAVARVTQVLSRRLVLVRGGGAELVAALRGVPGVSLVRTDPEAELPEDGGAAGFDEEERLLVAAWRARARPKKRPGEGLGWDAPGFLPPDRPGGGTA
ncbi:hypothetical protein ACFYVL_44520 [Streptomyces sp. NPDC004111]|uniref:hypothetical protein n=1 Tax=Streptomyces sp. NPDC004111 TaxID=3364690 RepID=UPI0036923DD6